MPFSTVSALAKWVLPEDDSDRVLQLAADAAVAGGQLIVLDLALIEVTNAVWKRVYRKLITPLEAQKFIDDLTVLPVAIAESKPLLKSAYQLAVKYRIAVYDAIFVALTIDLSQSGVTTDEPLVNAVKADYPQIHLLRNWPPAVP